MEQPIKPESKKGTLLMMCVLFILFQLTGIMFGIIGQLCSVEWVLQCVLMGIVAVMLYKTYTSHTKNVMKPLLGGALMLLLLFEMDSAAYYIEYFNEISSWNYNTTAITAYAIVQIALFVVIAIITLLHYSINSTHHSSPGKIKANKFFFIIFIALLVIQCISCVFLDSNVYEILCDIFSILADLFFLNIVIRTESSLDEFRLHREAVAEIASEESSEE